MKKFQAKKNKDGSYSIGQLGKNGKVNGLGMYLNPKTGKYIVGYLKDNKPNGWHFINQLENPEIKFKLDNNIIKASKYCKTYFGVDGWWCIQMFDKKHPIKGKCNYQISGSEDRWDTYDISTGYHGGYLVEENDRKVFQTALYERGGKQRAHLDPQKDTLFDPIGGEFTIPTFKKDYEFIEVEGGIAAKGDGPQIIYNAATDFTTLGFAKEGQYYGVVFLDCEDSIHLMEYKDGISNGLSVTCNKHSLRILIKKDIFGRHWPIVLCADPKEPSFSVMNFKYESTDYMDYLLNNFKTMIHYVKVFDNLESPKVKSRDLFSGN